LAKNEALAIQSLEVEKAKAVKNQTWSAAAPNLSYRHIILWQEELPSATGITNNFTRSPLPEGAFQVRLPLFRGISEWFAVKGGRDLVDQKEQEKKYIALQLYSDISSTYFNILLAQKNVELTDRALALTKDRYNELKRFVQLGRSKRSDLVELEDRLTKLETERLTLLANIKRTKNALESLVGQPIPALAAVPDFLSKAPTAIEPETMINSRQDVLAKQAAMDVAKANLNVRRTLPFPGIDAAFNYYTQRSGIRQGIDWDFTLGVQMPLFAFGNLYYGTKEAKATFRQSEFDLQRTRREAKLELQTVWDQLQHNLEKLPLVKKSAELTKRNYDMQSRDYRMGLVDNFHVLDSLSNFYDSDLAYERLQMETSFEVIRFYLAKGELPL